MTTTEERVLGDALTRYTDPSDPEFDPAFSYEIRTKQPDWFKDEPKTQTLEATALSNLGLTRPKAKAKVLALAKSSAPRPTGNLGVLLDLWSSQYPTESQLATWEKRLVAKV